VTDTSPTTRPPPLWLALVPVAFLVLFLLVQIRAFNGSANLPLILASVVAAVVGQVLGHAWKDMEAGIVRGISIATKAILILMVVGMLIGTWIASGIVPALIDYGLRLLRPGYFLLAACAVCSVVSVATGSSWTTAGTVGVALIGVGEGLGIAPAMTAGAIISGAYFGDKMSPLSDSTNLAPAVAGSELFEHIRYMLYTTFPALLVSLAMFGFLGWSVQVSSIDGSQVVVIRSVLAEHFDLSPVLLLAPALVILVVALRVPALPALIGGALLGGLMALWVQGSSLGQVLDVAQSGYAADTGSQLVDELLTRGGLESMMSTVALVLCALAFGGIMERIGALRALAEAILGLAHSTGSLVLATAASCIGTNVIAPDQYLSIIVPGRMYRETFEQRRLHPKLLSRTLEDAGTLSSPLVPWNTCGAFMSGALMVSTTAYLPYAFLNLLTPVFAVALAFSGFRIATVPESASSEPRGPGPSAPSGDLDPGAPF
jgi:NhaC family Na+:H+ antiporter